MRVAKMDHCSSVLCSNGLGAILRSFRNGRSIQTYAKLSFQERFFKTLEDGTRVKKGKDSDQEVMGC